MQVPSGAEVVVNVASFQEAFDLKNAVSKELSQANINFGLKDMSLKKDVDVGSLVKLALTVDSSPLVQTALWKCLARCTYNGAKVTKDTFEDEQTRADFYPIVVECLTVNLRDFFKPLVSEFLALLAKSPQSILASK